MQRGDDRRAHGRLLYTRADLRRAGIRMSNSTLLRLEAKGELPARVRIGRTVCWIADEVDQYIVALGRARGGVA